MTSISPAKKEARTPQKIIKKLTMSSTIGEFRKKLETDPDFQQHCRSLRNISAQNIDYTMAILLGGTQITSSNATDTDSGLQARLIYHKEILGSPTASVWYTTVRNRLNKLGNSTPTTNDTSLSENVDTTNDESDSQTPNPSDSDKKTSAKKNSGAYTEFSGTDFSDRITKILYADAISTYGVNDIAQVTLQQLYDTLSKKQAIKSGKGNSKKYFVYTDLLVNRPPKFPLKAEDVIKACGICFKEAFADTLLQIILPTVMERATDLIDNGDARQIVFTGAPGTGKTYIAKKIAEHFLANDRAGTFQQPDGSRTPYVQVQFHPSYDYTDFVEGLRPVELQKSQTLPNNEEKASGTDSFTLTKQNSSGDMFFAKVDGQFKDFCRKVVDANTTKKSDTLNEANKNLSSLNQILSLGNMDTEINHLKQVIDTHIQKETPDFGFDQLINRIQHGHVLDLLKVADPNPKEESAHNTYDTDVADSDNTVQAEAYMPINQPSSDTVPREQTELEVALDWLLAPSASKAEGKDLLNTNKIREWRDNWIDPDTGEIKNDKPSLSDCVKLHEELTLYSTAAGLKGKWFIEPSRNSKKDLTDRFDIIANHVAARANTLQKEIDEAKQQKETEGHKETLAKLLAIAKLRETAIILANQLTGPTKVAAKEKANELERCLAAEMLEPILKSFGGKDVYEDVFVSFEQLRWIADRLPKQSAENNQDTSSLDTLITQLDKAWQADRFLSKVAFIDTLGVDESESLEALMKLKKALEKKLEKTLETLKHAPKEQNPLSGQADQAKQAKLEQAKQNLTDQISQINSIVCFLICLMESKSSSEDALLNQLWAKWDGLPTDSRPAAMVKLHDQMKDGKQGKKKNDFKASAYELLDSYRSDLQNNHALISSLRASLRDFLLKDINTAIKSASNNLPNKPGLPKAIDLKRSETPTLTEKDLDLEKIPYDFYFFIIDEINRANLSKVFGELMYSLEKDKRGEENPIQTQYQNLLTYTLDGKPREPKEDVFFKGFYIPKNVVVIGTMNDIDRSVDSLDFALRRRFEWIEFKVTEESLMQAFQVNSYGKIINTHPQALAKRVMQLNNYMTEDKKNKQYNLTPQYYISQGYFANLPKKFMTASPTQAAESANAVTDLLPILTYVWEYRLESLLREYLRGQEESDIQEFIAGAKAQLLPKQDK